MPDKITVYNSKDEGDIARMVGTIESAFRSATVPPEDADVAAEIPDLIPLFDELIGIDPQVYEQINAAIRSGKQHLMFYGPPGTGKTTLAQKVASYLSDEWKPITGSSDWTSQDIIGGYFPLGDGKIAFLPGILLEHFDKPLIIDELNRCDIDKVIGPLFTVLSGQSTSLPYLTNPSDPNSSRIVILPKGKPDPPKVFAPTPEWRLIATINSIDKASLYQMSYALTRRFAWIYIDVPANLDHFVREYLKTLSPAAPDEGGQSAEAEDAPATATPLAKIWGAVNEVRKVGPAPFIDIIHFIKAAKPDFLFLETTVSDPNPYLNGFYVFLLPMLDGILSRAGSDLSDRIAGILAIESSPLHQTLTERLLAMTV